MDPDANLKEQLEIVEGDDEEALPRLAELVSGLDGWIERGGFLPQRWAKTCNGGFLDRALLAQRVYKEAYDSTHSFDGGFGMQLSYLMGAILEGGDAYVSFNTHIGEETAVLLALHDIFPVGHPVWKYVRAESSIPFD